MGDALGQCFGLCCGAICSAVAESLQFTYLSTNACGLNSCVCCDKCCRCSCCWKEGELPVDDYPDPSHAYTTQPINSQPTPTVTNLNPKSTYPPPPLDVAPPAYRPTDQMQVHPS